MIISPARINTDDGQEIHGVIIDNDALSRIISLIDSNASNGLKGADAVLLLKLKEAAAAWNRRAK